MLFQLAAHLEIGGAHGEAQGPGLGAAGDDAAVVVGEHHQGPAPQGGIQGRLAGGIEVVAIDQHDRHGWRGSGGWDASAPRLRGRGRPPWGLGRRHLERMDGMGGHPPEQGVLGIAQLQGRVGGMGRLQP